MRLLMLVSTVLLAGSASASPTEKSLPANLEKLAEAALPLAKQVLQNEGEFQPYGFAVDSKGKVTSLAGYAGIDHPPVAEMIDLLRSSCRKEVAAKRAVSCALTYQVRVTPPGQSQKSDAIAVALDHVQGASMVMVVPYQVNPDKSVEFAQRYLAKGKGEMFH